MAMKKATRGAARLTEKAIARAAAKGQALRLYDPGTKGFGAKVSAGGGVSFFVRYGPRNRRRFLGLGRSSENFSLEDARKLAVKTLGKVADGKDPVAERAAERKEMLFPAWASKYAERTDRRRKEKFAPAYYLGIASRRWARRSLGSLTMSDVLDFRDSLATEGAKAGKKLEREDHTFDGHATANRALANVAACFAQAVKEGILSKNPAVGVPKLPEADPRQRIPTDEEMERLLAALEHEDEFTRAVFLMLVETGARVSEVLRARWQDFNLQAATWLIPRPKSGKPRLVPLAQVTVERLQKLHRLGEWLIPARTDDKIHRFDVKKDWARIKRAAKLGDLHIHDIRRGFGARVTRSAGMHYASKILGHSDIRTTQRIYSPLDFDSQRAAVEGVAALLPFPKKQGAA